MDIPQLTHILWTIILSKDGMFYGWATFGHLDFLSWRWLCCRILNLLSALRTSTAGKLSEKGWQSSSWADMIFHQELMSKFNHWNSKPIKRIWSWTKSISFANKCIRAKEMVTVNSVLVNPHECPEAYKNGCYSYKAFSCGHFWIECQNTQLIHGC